MWKENIQYLGLYELRTVIKDKGLFQIFYWLYINGKYPKCQVGESIKYW